MGHTQPNFSGAIAHALGRLRAELPPYLTYHNLWHTEQDVMPAAERLGRRCGLPEAQAQALQVAAAYHDIGFVEALVEHERASARIAAASLPGFGFSEQLIEQITGMIAATRLPQSPRNLLEQIMADADLDVLGRADFFQRNAALRAETAARGTVFADRVWLEDQVRFLSEHRYFTPAARSLRDEGKRQHLAIVLGRLDGA
jgi:predicted metal-dependent HD superfamily phosphohydrolase